VYLVEMMSGGTECVKMVMFILRVASSCGLISVYYLNLNFFRIRDEQIVTRRSSNRRTLARRRTKVQD
jgi:hypothetical protein